MNLGIMQPYFFPNTGHFSLIDHTDRWIVFDSVQFIRHGWIERNRILKPGEGWQYICVPLVKHSRNTLIKDVKIRTSENWRDLIFRQLQHYKKAPFYEQTIVLLKKCMEIETDSITDLNVHVLRTICHYLDIQFDYTIYSNLDLGIVNVEHAGDWALKISQQFGATTYTNPIGGKLLFDQDAFNRAGLRLSFLEAQNTEYAQKGNKFEPGLSIIDTLMFNSIEETKGQIKNYRIL